MTDDIDRLFALYNPDGSASWTTARELMSAGDVTFEQITEAERHSVKFYKPIHDAVEAARRSGVSEETQATIDAFRKRSEPPMGD